MRISLDLPYAGVVAIPGYAVDPLDLPYADVVGGGSRGDKLTDNNA